MIGNIEYKRINSPQWINSNTMSSTTVVELGAGFFKNMNHVSSNVKTKIGIEIYEPYINNAINNDCIKIHGDALKYRELLVKYDFETVLIYDVLEHFDKDVALKLISDLKTDFKKILLMLPFGKYEQHEDVTGYGAHEYQTHRSYWYEEDILKLGFNDNIIDLNYHATPNRVDNNLDTGCYFGVWNK